MSTKLNAEKLANEWLLRSPRTREHPLQTYAYTAAIREVAQPIADQRDELREALSNEVGRMANLIRAIDMLKDSPVSRHCVLMNGVEEARQRLTYYRAILAKYSKP